MRSDTEVSGCSESETRPDTRGPSGRFESFETPIKLHTQHSEFVCEGRDTQMSLSFVRDSPFANCLTNALGRSLSQTKEFCHSSGQTMSFGDFCTQTTNQNCEFTTGYPAKKPECLQTIKNSSEEVTDSNDPKKKPVEVWRTSKKI